MSVETPESALLVPVPEAEQLVGDLRLEHDPSAGQGIPAHVTLLYPFADADAIDEETVEDLRTMFAASAPFRYRFLETRWFGQEVLYLAPEPATPFIWLTERLAARFPGSTPYGGAFEEIVPHLTVAMVGSAEMESRLRDALPLEAVAAEVWLMDEGPDSRWTTRTRFRLGRG